MEQTFGDLLREREQTGRGLVAFTLWVYLDTLAGIINEHMRSIMHISRTLKFILGALCLLFIPLFAEIFMVAGWDWSPGDFAIMAVLLTGFGAAVAYATGERTLRQRIMGGAIVLFVLALYVHLAVGIVDWLPFAGS